MKCNVVFCLRITVVITFPVCYVSRPGCDLHQPPAASLNPALFWQYSWRSCTSSVWFSFAFFFFYSFSLNVCCFILCVLIPSVIWSSFSLEWLKIPMFFSFYNCLFENRHSMRVSNPLLSNHASCITVENCVVLVILARRNTRTDKSSVSSNLRHLKRNSSETVIETALCLRTCMHASLNFICTAFYWSIEALCH